LLLDGDSNPAFNTNLAIAIANAKLGQLSKTAIEAAIARGQGKSVSGVPLESVVVEAMLPHGVAAILEYQTEYKAKVLQDTRLIINKNGGTVTPTSFLFDKKGKIWFQEGTEFGVDEVMDDAIEAGATDIAMEDGRLVLETEPADLSAVTQNLPEKYKRLIERSELMYDPKEEARVKLDSLQSSQLSTIIDLIEDESSLQNIYLNVDV
jgi:transcriptional/translational regulatory protein YebC/TACO1